MNWFKLQHEEAPSLLNDHIIPYFSYYISSEG